MTHSSSAAEWTRTDTPKAIKTNQEECAALKLRIADLVTVAAKPWEGKSDEDIPSDTMIMIESLRE